MKLIDLTISLAVGEFIVFSGYFIFSKVIRDLLFMLVPKGLPTSLVETTMTCFSIATVGLAVAVILFCLWYAVRQEYDKYYRY